WGPAPSEPAPPPQSDPPPRGSGPEFGFPEPPKRGGGAPRPPGKKPKKALTTLEECQLLEKRGYVLAPYLVKQKTAELQRLKRRDAELYDRWLERRGPYTNEDAAEDVEARQIWREIAALERELKRVERAAELDCRELLRPEDFPPS
ncbi:MAG: hypothetical protein WBL45_09270, partial [Solirubrobacterales bacterium]